VSPSFISQSHFLDMLQEEMDKMIEAEGLILKGVFHGAMEDRLRKEITRALAKDSGTMLPL